MCELTNQKRLGKKVDFLVSFPTHQMLTPRDGGRLTYHPQASVSAFTCTV